ncbi:MAG: hypothetical protein ACREA5_01990 [Nitrosotalea sp.]
MERFNKKNLKVLYSVVVLGIAIFGLTSTMLITSVNVTYTQFQTTSFILQNVDTNNTTVLASPTYAWILHYVFHKENIPNDYSFVLFNHLKTDKTLLVADPHFLIDLGRGKQLQQIYNDSKTIATFDEDLSKYDMSVYPYSNMMMNVDGELIQVQMK